MSLRNTKQVSQKIISLFSLLTEAIFYPSLFKHPNLAELMPIVLGIRQRKVPSWQKVLFKAIMPVLATTILKRNDITKEAEEEAW